jgi:hypothetical protein
MNHIEGPQSHSPKIQQLGPSTSSTLVILDGGFTHDRTVWSRIISAFQSTTMLLTIERTHYPNPPVIDLAFESGAIRDAIEKRGNSAGHVDVKIAVGIAAGNLILRESAERWAELLSSLVLIAPSPMGSQVNRTDESCTRRNSAVGPRMTLPVTIILPGSSEATPHNRDPERHQLHAQDLERFLNRREVIAGRSRDNILLERPDVVIDAIQRLIETQSLANLDEYT